MNFDTHSYPHTWALKGVPEGEELHRRWATGGPEGSGASATSGPGRRNVALAECVATSKVRFEMDAPVRTIIHLVLSPLSPLLLHLLLHSAKSATRLTGRHRDEDLRAAANEGACRSRLPPAAPDAKRLPARRRLLERGRVQLPVLHWLHLAGLRLVRRHMRAGGVCPGHRLRQGRLCYREHLPVPEGVPRDERPAAV
jgi:hypothetical protein